MAVAVGAGDPLLTPQEQISEKLKELADGLGFDPIQLQAKYKEERENVFKTAV